MSLLTLTWQQSISGSERYPYGHTPPDIVSGQFALYSFSFLHGVGHPPFQHHHPLIYNIKRDCR